MVYVIFMLNNLQIVCYNLLGSSKYPRTRMFACNYFIYNEVMRADNNEYIVIFL